MMGRDVTHGLSNTHGASGSTYKVSRIYIALIVNLCLAAQKRNTHENEHLHL